MTRKRKTPIRPRAVIVQAMRLHTKPGPHRGRKKESSRMKCRKFRRQRGETGEE